MLIAHLVLNLILEKILSLIVLIFRRDKFIIILKENIHLYFLFIWKYLKKKKKKKKNENIENYMKYGVIHKNKRLKTLWIESYS